MVRKLAASTAYTSMLTILRITSAPNTCMITPPASILLAHRIGEQRHHVFGIQMVDGQKQHRRQCQQHDAAKPAFAGQRLHLSENFESLADQTVRSCRGFQPGRRPFAAAKSRPWRRTADRRSASARSCCARLRRAGCQGSAPRNTRPKFGADRVAGLFRPPGESRLASYARPATLGRSVPASRAIAWRIC